jgi:hypothetical protein
MGAAECIYRSSNIEGLQCNIVTKRRTDGGWGKHKCYYCIDGDEREFEATEQLMESYNERGLREKETLANEGKRVWKPIIK